MQLETVRRPARSNESRTRAVGDQSFTIAHFERLLQHRAGPIDVLEPMRGRRHGQQVGADFWEKVARHFATGSLGQRGSSHPARDAADALQIGHHEIGRVKVERFQHLINTREIFANLNRSFQLGSHTRTTGQVVGPHGFFNPNQPLAVEHSSAMDRFVDRQRLIEISHQQNIAWKSAAHRPHGSQVFGRRRTAQPNLDGAKTFGNELQRLPLQLLATGMMLSPLLL